MKTSLFRRYSQTKSVRDRFLGAYVPWELSSYLTLWCMVTGLKKSDVINGLLEQWKSEEVSTTDLEVRMSQLVWTAYRKLTTVRKRKAFRNRVHYDLLKKGIPADAIARITEKIEEHAKGE